MRKLSISSPASKINFTRCGRLLLDIEVPRDVGERPGL
jgi:hypothetical protein